MIVKFAKINFYSKKMQRNIDKGSYCPYGSLMEQIQPLLTKYGFSVHFSQDTDVSGGRVRVTGYVRHRAGHKEPLAFESNADRSGDKEEIQAIGSTRTYAKRYAIQDFFNLRMVNDDEIDDDGNLTGKTVSQGDESMGKFAARMRQLQDAPEDEDQTPQEEAAANAPETLDAAWDVICTRMEEDEISEEQFVKAMRKLLNDPNWKVTDLQESHAIRIATDRWKKVKAAVMESQLDELEREESK